MPEGEHKCFVQRLYSFNRHHMAAVTAAVGPSRVMEAVVIVFLTAQDNGKVLNMLVW